MSLLRRRMMMAKEPDVPDNPTDEWDYFTIVMEEDGELDIRNSYVSFFAEEYTSSFQYSINKGGWIECNDIICSLNVNTGDNIRVKSYDINSVLKQDITSAGEYRTASIYSKYKYHVKGTVMSLLYGDDFKDKYSMSGFTLDSLFNDIGFVEYNRLTKIENPNIFLPATELSEFCYAGMFANCKYLINAPKLPATIIAEGCYADMFSGCISLNKAPELPATTLAEDCYSYMFVSCENLNYIKMLATDVPNESCLHTWVQDVSSTGTFVKHPDMTSLPTGTGGIPEGWTVVNDGEESGGLNIVVPITDGYGEFTREQIDQINNYCLQFGDSFRGAPPERFNLTINGLAISYIQWTLISISGLGDSFEFQIDFNGIGYILMY